MFTSSIVGIDWEKRLEQVCTNNDKTIFILPYYMITFFESYVLFIFLEFVVQNQFLTVYEICVVIFLFFFVFQSKNVRNYFFLCVRGAVIKIGCFVHWKLFFVVF